MCSLKIRARQHKQLDYRLFIVRRHGLIPSISWPAALHSNFRGQFSQLSPSFRAILNIKTVPGVSGLQGLASWENTALAATESSYLTKWDDMGERRNHHRRETLWELDKEEITLHGPGKLGRVPCGMKPTKRKHQWGFHASQHQHHSTRPSQACRSDVRALGKREKQD